MRTRINARAEERRAFRPRDREITRVKIYSFNPIQFNQSIKSVLNLGRAGFSIKSLKASFNNAADRPLSGTSELRLSPSGQQDGHGLPILPAESLPMPPNSRRDHHHHHHRHLIFPPRRFKFDSFLVNLRREIDVLRSLSGERPSAIPEGVLGNLENVPEVLEMPLGVLALLSATLRHPLETLDRPLNLTLY